MLINNLLDHDKTKKINKTLNLLYLAFFLLVIFYETAIADEYGILTGLVMDVSRNPMAGVEVYVYKDSNIRRPADYISPPTDKSGEFRITLPPGRYWVVARLRQGEQKYGPLLPGDKHSGSPLEIDVSPGEPVEEEFVIADLEETSQLTVKFDTSFIKIDGVLQTKEGEPVENAYAFANRQAVAKKIPDYVGAWTENNGEFTLFLPEGTYYLGMARVFPPGSEIVPTQKILVDNNSKNIHIIIK